MVTFGEVHAGRTNAKELCKGIGRATIVAFVY